MEKDYKGLCQENNNGICNFSKCKKADCPIGEKLIEIFNASPKCGENCVYIEEGIKNGSSPYQCKDISCTKENAIFELRKGILSTKIRTNRHLLMNP